MGLSRLYSDEQRRSPSEQAVLQPEVRGMVGMFAAVAARVKQTKIAAIIRTAELQRNVMIDMRRLFAEFLEAKCAAIFLELAKFGNIVGCVLSAVLSFGCSVITHIGEGLFSAPLFALTKFVSARDFPGSNKPGISSTFLLSKNLPAFRLIACATLGNSPLFIGPIPRARIGALLLGYKRIPRLIVSTLRCSLFRSIRPSHLHSPLYALA